jgi:hypothetical protein
MCDAMILNSFMVGSHFISQISCCCEKMHGVNTVREKRFILAHSFRVHCWLAPLLWAYGEAAENVVERICSPSGG